MDHGFSSPTERSAQIHPAQVGSERELATLAALLGAAAIPNVSRQEYALLARGMEIPGQVVTETADRIRTGDDPLGDAFCTLRSASVRRNEGAIYTPPLIVERMLSWAEATGTPDVVVDPGTGSGRYLIEAGRRFPRARLIGVEEDAIAALTARANLAVCGFADRSEVRVEDFRDTRISHPRGRTLFIGNPPYVRHHGISPNWKSWLKAEAAQIGVTASALAGLHIHFFLAIARLGRPGDFGALITSAEWLDVNYGRLVRNLFLKELGGKSVYIVEPDAEPFPGTATTGAIATFEFGSKSSTVRFARGAGLPAGPDLGGGKQVSRKALERETKWSCFSRPKRDVPTDFIELGDLFSVHRGQATGANRVWIAGNHSEGLPQELLFPTVTKARELFQNGPILTEAEKLRRVIDIPRDLSVLSPTSRNAVDSFLKCAETMGARSSYIAQHREPWWSVRLRSPAPILATYMARRPPAFVLNEASVRHLNIAHGLYPREPVEAPILSALVKWLRESASIEGGRVYAGGLTKFEPREMERIKIPGPSALMEGTS